MYDLQQVSLSGQQHAAPPRCPLTCRRAQSSLMSHSGLSCPASVAGFTRVGNGLANCVCCFNKMFFFCSFPSRRIFSIPGVARSKSERGGMTASPCRCFFFLPTAGRGMPHSVRQSRTTDNTRREPIRNQVVVVAFCNVPPWQA